MEDFDEDANRMIWFWALIALMAAVAIVLSCSGCAIVDLPSNVERVAVAAEKIDANTYASARIDAKDDPKATEWLQKARKAVDATKTTQEDFGWLQTILSALGGVFGSYPGAGMLLAVAGWGIKAFQQWQTARKLEAAYDATDLALSKVPEEDKEPVKMAMRVNAVSHGVHKQVKRDLARRRK